MAAPNSFFTLTILFSAKSYSDFEAAYNLLCKTAGGGIKNTYQMLKFGEYSVLFFYPTEKSFINGKERFKELAEKMNIIIK